MQQLTAQVRTQLKAMDKHIQKNGCLKIAQVLFKETPDIRQERKKSHRYSSPSKETTP